MEPGAQDRQRFFRMRLDHFAHFADGGLADLSVDRRAAQIFEQVVVEVSDDGIGGVTIEGSTGLRGLADLQRRRGPPRTSRAPRRHALGHMRLLLQESIPVAADMVV